MLWFVRFIICNTMKEIILLLTAISCLVSCSWVDSNTREDIQEEVQKAKNEIVQLGTQQVENAKARIENEITNSVRKANDNIDTLVKASIAQIEQATDQKVQQAIDNEIKKLEGKMKNLFIVAVLGAVFGLCGILICVICMLRLRKAAFREEVIYHVINSERIKDHIRKFVEDKTLRTKSIDVNPEEIRGIVKRFISDPKTLECLAKEIAQRNTIKNDISVLSIEQPAVNVETQLVQRFELYAKNSNTGVLSDIFPSHQKGKTIYKLVLDNPNSTTAVLDLCIDKEDAVGRILRFDDEDLESVCTVSRKSDKPERVHVLKKGKVEKMGNSEWNVIEKIVIELS